MMQPKKGDRVRVTWEGVYYSHPTVGHHLLTNGTGGLYGVPVDAVIEVMAPALPEEPAPWSIVSNAAGDAWQRGETTNWYCAVIDDMGHTWAELNARFGPLTVLREGRGQ